MTVASKREKLKSYIDDVNDKKVKTLYALLEDDIDQNSTFTLSEEQLKILDEEHALHMSGKTKSYTWEEAKDIIRGKKSM
jgi:hypothetical protein